MVNLSSTPLLHSPCDMWVTFYRILHCLWRTAGIRQYLNHIAGRFHPGNGAADSAVLTLLPAGRRLLLPASCPSAQGVPEVSRGEGSLDPVRYTAHQQCHCSLAGDCQGVFSTAVNLSNVISGCCTLPPL
jgi:hypothetical protein